MSDQAAARAAPTGWRAAAGGPVVAAVALPLVAALAMAVAATPWLRAFSIPGAAPLLIGSAVASVAIPPLVARVAHQPATVSYGVSAAALVLVVAIGVSHDPAALGHGLGSGPTRLLSETLPVTGGRALLLAPMVLVWLCGAASSEILTRTRRSAPALLPPVVAYVVAYAATTGAPQGDDVTGALLLASLALLALARRAAADADQIVLGTDRHWPGRARRTAAGAVLAAVLTVVLAAAVPPAVGGAPATVIRHPPTDTGFVVDPVDAVAALRDSDPHAPARTLFMLTTSTRAPGYYDIALLGGYDGDTWSFDTTFTPTGGRVPAPGPGQLGTLQGVGTTTVTGSVRIVRSYGLPFVPMMDRTARVSGLDFDVDAADGLAVPARTPHIPTSFRFTAWVPAVTISSVPAGDAPDLAGRGAPGYLALPPGTAPDIAAGLRYLATITGQRPEPTLAFLQAAAAAMQASDRRIDPALSSNSSAPTVSRGGTSLAEVMSAVVVAHRATPEQFATFLVLMARQLGVPARIATGFRLAPSPASPDVGAGTHVVTNREAWTWAEIPVAGVGWVVADPTPVLTASQTTLPPSAAAAVPTTVPPRQPNAVVGNLGGGNHALARPAPIRLPPPPPSSAGEVAAGIAAFVLVLLLAGPGLAAGRRARRRRLRRADDPAALAAGAWLELLDGLELAGLRAEGGATSAEVSLAASRHFGDEVAAPVGEVGALADRAVFSPHHPPDPAAAAGAWRAQRDLRRRLLATLDRPHRARALLHVGHQPARPAATGRPEHRRRSHPRGEPLR